MFAPDSATPDSSYAALLNICPHVEVNTIVISVLITLPQSFTITIGILKSILLFFSIFTHKNHTLYSSLT